MDERERKVLHWVWADTLDDHGQLWSMAKRTREEYGLTDWRDVKRETLRILGSLLLRGVLRAGQSHPDRFDPWPGGPAEHLQRISEAWDALGREPNIWEIVWFDITELGERELGALFQRKPNATT